MDPGLSHLEVGEVGETEGGVIEGDEGTQT